jgi:nicotinamidase-related amidase
MKFDKTSTFSSNDTAGDASTALLVIDAQESFRHRPYWTDCDEPSFVKEVQSLIDGAQSRRIPVLQIFHIEDSGPFAPGSGHVRCFNGLRLAPDAVFHKRSHSALIGSGLEVWLVRHGVRRVIISGIRSEQCCETTTRHAADLGYQVDYVTEATLTFPMIDRHGKRWSTQEIKARCELVLEERFARIVGAEQALNATKRSTGVFLPNDR